MNNEKLENLLNLSLDATSQEREKSLELEVGYDTAQKLWEVIVKYTGNLSDVLAQESIRRVELLYGYGILTLPERLLDPLADSPQITYVEKPKRLFFAEEAPIVEKPCTGKSHAAAGKTDAEENMLFQMKKGGEEICQQKNQAENNPETEVLAQTEQTGRGVLVAILDSGIDYTHPDFRNPDGSTRILSLWDQTLKKTDANQPGQVPERYGIGLAYTSEEINAALKADSQSQPYTQIPSRDLSGHGTHVAGIAAGNGEASDGRYRGIAPDCELLIVKLGNPMPDSFPKTTQLLMAVDYALRKAQEVQLPVVVNISFGNNYGGHDGTSLLETYLDEVASYWKNVIVTGTGNEGIASVHTSGSFFDKRQEEIAFSVGTYETGFNIQLWKFYGDEIEIRLRPPSGGPLQSISQQAGIQRFQIGNTILLVYYGMPSPYSISQEIYFDFIPVYDYVDSGIWELLLTPVSVKNGNYDLWLPGQVAVSAGTGFLYPTETTTLTIPSTATKVISVAAYNEIFQTAADFSGRGYTRYSQQIKPDVAAPGVDIVSTAPGGGYAMRSGTSMAAPYVSGLSALLMEYGIVQKKDSFLFGEKIKASLIRSARQLPGLETPNPVTGWGTVI